jgi:hypothetical protein
MIDRDLAVLYEVETRFLNRLFGEISKDFLTILCSSLIIKSLKIGNHKL